MKELNFEQQNILSAIDNYANSIKDKEIDVAVRKALRIALSVKAGSISCEHGIYDKYRDNKLICLYCGLTAPDSLIEIEQSESSFENDSLTPEQEIELEKIEALKIAKLWGK